jgi:neopullulanase
VRRAFAQAKPVPELAFVTGHDSLYSRPNDLVTFLGNHDVARFLNEPGASIDGLKLAFTYLFTTRGIPMIYSGDEIALRGGNDPENRKDFPGGWKDDTRSAFDPAQRNEEERGLFDYVRKVALLRQQTAELRTARLTQIGVGRDVYVYTRGPLIVMLNNGSNPVKIDAPAASGTWKNLLDVAVNVAVHDRIMSVTVPPRSAMIMMQR